jgi:hypothetical protein
MRRRCRYYPIHHLLLLVKQGDVNRLLRQNICETTGPKNSVFSTRKAEGEVPERNPTESVPRPIDSITTDDDRWGVFGFA